MSSRLRAVGVLLVITLGAAGAAAALHHLGRYPWLQVEPSLSWLDRTPPMDALAGGLRLAGMALAAWVAVTTGAHLLAALAGLRPALGLTGRLVAPIARRAGSIVLAGALALPSAPALAGTGPRPSPAVEAPVEPGPDPSWPGTVRRPHPAAPETGQTEEVTVRAGDNLWGIAARRLESAIGRPPTPPEIVPYWLEVIDRNLPRLRSGEADLIYPGEVISLPPPPGPVTPPGS